MKKKYMKLIKIFLALVIAFSQLSNAAVVFADEISDSNTDDVIISGDNDNDNELVGEELANNEDILPDENEDSSDEFDNELGEEPERVLTLEDLESMMDSYINGTELSEEIINLLIEAGSPSIENGEFTAVTLEDIMFVNELLKEEPDTDTDREENVNLTLELGEIPKEVVIGKTFDVQILVSNEEKEDDENVILVGDVDDLNSTDLGDSSNDETGEELDVVPEYIDGIEGLISTSENLSLKDIAYTEFTGVKNEEGKFVAAGAEFGEDKGVLVTLTFEALELGTGEVTISGSLAKYLTIVNLSFSIEVVGPTGLNSLTSDVGQLDKEFDSETTEYTLTVPAGTTEVTLSGSLVNGNAKVTGLSTYTLEEDETTIEIIVTEEDESTKTYVIKVVRGAAEEEAEPVMEEAVATEVVETPVVTPIAYVYSSNSYLKTLSIKDYDINFEKGVLEYKLKVGADVKFLDITAVAEDYRSRVEINGNEEFKDGENVVTIKVTAEDGSVREYKLLVDKQEEPARGELEEVEESSGRAEKIVIITLIVLVVGGLLYLIFIKDEAAAGAKVASEVVNKNKNKNKKN